MARSKLLWRVDVYEPRGQPWWEPIAAFNHDGVAEHYAKDCFYKNAGLGFGYRVVGPRSKVLKVWPAKVIE